MSESDLIALITPTPAEAPPESVAVNPSNGDVYVFAHDVLAMFRIENIASPSPTTTFIDPTGWFGFVDLHDLAVDDAGNIYGFDEGNETIVIWDGANAFAYPLADLGELVGGMGAPGVEPALWRGIAVRTIDANRSELFLASANPDYGVVRVVFGAAPTAVANWAAYE